LHLQQRGCEKLASHYEFFEVRDNWKPHELRAETGSFRISLCQCRKNFVNSQKGNLRGICFAMYDSTVCTLSDKKGKFQTVEGK